MAGQGTGLALFNDAHSFLRDVSDEVESVKRLIATEDEKRRVEIEELRRDQEQERFERRDALNKLRYEFEEFVRRKIDRVLEEVQEMRRMGRSDDTAQQQKLDSLIADFNRLKEHLFVVQSAWGKLVSNCVTPAQQEELAKSHVDQEHQEQAEKGGAK